MGIAVGMSVVGVLGIAFFLYRRSHEEDDDFESSSNPNSTGGEKSISPYPAPFQSPMGMDMNMNMGMGMGMGMGGMQNTMNMKGASSFPTSPTMMGGNSQYSGSTMQSYSQPSSLMGSEIGHQSPQFRAPTQRAPGSGGLFRILASAVSTRFQQVSGRQTKTGMPVV